MPRQLKQSSTMVLVEGNETAPSTCQCEYSVALGDLNEDFKVYVEPSPDFTTTVDALWTYVMTTVETNEAI